MCLLQGVIGFLQGVIGLLQEVIALFRCACVDRSTLIGFLVVRAERNTVAPACGRDRARGSQGGRESVNTASRMTDNVRESNASPSLHFVFLHFVFRQRFPL
jgi:hypothetical protein